MTLLLLTFAGLLAIGTPIAIAMIASSALVIWTEGIPLTHKNAVWRRAPGGEGHWPAGTAFQRGAASKPCPCTRTASQMVR